MNRRRRNLFGQRGYFEFLRNVFFFSVSQSIFIYSLIDFKPLTYEDYDYPEWADILGWGLSLLSIVQIPLWAVISIIRMDAPTWKEVNMIFIATIR